MEKNISIESYIKSGDSISLMKEIPDLSVHLIITSPPYWSAVEYQNKNYIGNGSYEKYIKDLSKIWKECERVLKPNGKLCINSPIMPIPKKIINNHHIRHVKNINNDIEFSIIQKTNLQRFSLFIWQKQTSKLMFGSYPYPGNILEQNTIEFINVFVKEGKPEKREKKHKDLYKLTQKDWIDLTRQIWFMYPEDIFRIKNHPAPFPEKLPARLIKLYTLGSYNDYPGDIILDPFCGLGTVPYVAKIMNRRFIGFDISEEYINYAKERITNSKQTEINYFVGSPKYPNKQELNDLLIDKNDKALALTKHKEKHKKTSYGRGFLFKKQEELINA
jgi:DNA modification methylase